MTSDSINVVISGEAGQGLATIGQVFTKALVKAGYYIVVTQSYQSRIRGGCNAYSVRISPLPIESPVEKVDVLVALSDEAYRVNRDAVLDSGLIMADEKIDLSGETRPHTSVKRPDDARYFNVFFLGVLARALGVDSDSLREALTEFFVGHHPDAVQKNLDSLEEGRQWASSQPDHMDRPLPTAARKGFCMINGNEAIAIGAMSAGLKFFSFYPMTPATSVANTLAPHAATMGFLVEQAEDEIAAINMAIGASFAGAPSMTATSGGGFALMTEAVSLAGMTETPIVIVVAQRPGPSTGLPTRTEQGDLEFVLHAGHGEFPRVLYAPGSVEECFHLTREAFLMAEKSRGPVFILTDQFLADSYRSVEPFDLEAIPSLNVCNDLASSEKPFQTYQITASGVSPRLAPGLVQSCVRAWSSEQLAVADSDEHTEDGHLTEDLHVRKLMVQKRWRKLSVIKDHVRKPLFFGDKDPDVLLVCWGSSLGAVRETVARKIDEGQSFGMLHFSQVWPIVAKDVLPYLQSAKRVIGVESNFTGQFSRLLRRETGFDISERILRYDGLPLTLEYVLDRISA
ncbi:MAG: 2-oxoacid:acceptor oxidoreductase subunit alpha [Desulfomonilaceae bacterium]